MVNIEQTVASFTVTNGILPANNRFSILWVCFLCEGIVWGEIAVFPSRRGAGHCARRGGWVAKPQGGSLSTQDCGGREGGIVCGSGWGTYSPATFHVGGLAV